MGTAQIIHRELDIFDIETDIPGIGRSEKLTKTALLIRWTMKIDLFKSNNTTCRESSLLQLSYLLLAIPHNWVSEPLPILTSPDRQVSSFEVIEGFW